MTNCYHTTHRLPFLPAKDRQLAEQTLNRQEERQRQATASRAQKAGQILDGLRRQLHDLVGAKKLVELRQGLDRERVAFRDLWQPPESLTRNYTQQKKTGKRKIDALLRKLGVSSEKIKQAGLASEEKLRKLLTVTDGKITPGFNLPKNLDKWMYLSPLHTLPLPWGVLLPPDDPNDPHRWFLFRPPFFGFLFRFAPQATSNFRVDRQHFLDPSAGLVGNEATMDCDDAGDFDAASVTAEAQIAFGFVPPVAGLVEVLIDAQSTISTQHVQIEDEWGFSNAWCNQNNSLMMNVLHPNVPDPSLALMANLYEETDGDDLQADRQNLTPGQHYFAHLFSSGPVPAGQTVVVTAGTRTFDIARANDMELHSRTNFQWFINSVEVRISP